MEPLNHDVFLKLLERPGPIQPRRFEGCPLQFNVFHICSKKNMICEAPLSKRLFFYYARLLRRSILDAMDSLIRTCVNMSFAKQAL